MNNDNLKEVRLEQDLAYRFGYLTEFIGFNEADIAAVHGVASALVPFVTGLVDAVYEKLFGYDATKRHFVKRQSAFNKLLWIQNDLINRHYQAEWGTAEQCRPDSVER